jgi:uncharacterized membrane protein
VSSLVAKGFHAAKHFMPPNEGVHTMAADDQAQEAVDQQQDNGAAPSRLSRLLSKDVLVPVAATAVTAAAAGLAAKKAPDVKNKLVGEAREGAEDLGRSGAEGAKQALGSGGGPIGAVAGAASKLLPGKGKDGGGGHKKTRRLPIQRWTDVAVPVERAYEQWTKFEEFPKFMHRVLDVEQNDDDTVEWTEKIWFSKRQWKGEITDRRKNDRIAWKTVSGTQHTGIVSFHRLDRNLTRVLVTIDFQPAGMIEKMGSGLRFAKRAVQADLARFKAYVELGEAEGVEYESVPAAQENEGGEEQREQQENRGDSESSNEKSSNEKGSNEKSSNGSQSDEERDAERREREQRRQERRETVSAS